MSREIKFRVWDKEENEMVCWKDISRTNSLGIFVNNHNRNDSRGILSQYTGLKDKKGVEIYEGDIVDYFDGKSGYTDFIEWEQGCFFLRGYTTHELSSMNLNVIGNIYENAELLT